MIPATCSTCHEPTVVGVGTRTYCTRHYRQLVEPILRKHAYAGLDARTGRAAFDPVDLDAPLGWMTFDRPVPGWPTGYALMRCDVCGYEAVRPQRGELCDRCVARGRLWNR